jgi:hypothetical protein
MVTIAVPPDKLIIDIFYHIRALLGRGKTWIHYTLSTAVFSKKH